MGEGIGLYRWLEQGFTGAYIGEGQGRGGSLDKFIFINMQRDPHKFFSYILRFHAFFHWPINYSRSFKGTVSVLSGDLTCKDGNARFTTVPWKDLTDKVN